MTAPPQAVAGLVWAIVGPPVVLFAATRVRRGRLRLHAALMLASVAIELEVDLEERQRRKERSPGAGRHQAPERPEHRALARDARGLRVARAPEGARPP